MDLSDHILWLCADNRVEAKHGIAIGTGGVGKRKRGDKKTPLGTYLLGTPRASSSFGTFIPIGYPTAEQRRDGYTGSAIGIHGPQRAFTGAGKLNISVDWTLGCIAVQSDAAIGSIAVWIKEKRPKWVHLNN